LLALIVLWAQILGAIIQTRRFRGIANLYGVIILFRISHLFAPGTFILTATVCAGVAQAAFIQIDAFVLT
jgi:hypothetical protein